MIFDRLNEMKISREVNEKYNFLKPIEFCNLVRFGKVHDGGYIVPEKIIKRCQKSYQNEVPRHQNCSKKAA